MKGSQELPPLGEDAGGVRARPGRLRGQHFLLRRGVGTVSSCSGPRPSSSSRAASARAHPLASRPPSTNDERPWQLGLITGGPPRDQAGVCLPTPPGDHEPRLSPEMLCGSRAPLVPHGPSPVCQAEKDPT